jgi:V/A-type H+/Na+-transporting ATPase subunit B
VRRKQPSELIATGIAGIDLNNTLVTGQKIPFFADPDQPFNQVMANGGAARAGRRDHPGRHGA